MNSRVKKFLIRGIELCAALALCIPLYVAPQTLYPYVFPKIVAFQSIIEIASVLWLALVACDRSYLKILKAPITVSLFSFLGIAFLASLFGIDLLRSLYSSQERMTGIILMAHLFAWYVLLGSVFRTMRQWRSLLWVSLAVSAFVGISSIDPNVIGDFLFHGKKWQPLSSLGNPIYLGVYAMLHVFLALVAHACAVKKYQKGIAIAAFLVNVFSIYISASRGPIIALGIGGAIALFFHIIIRQSAQLRKNILIGALILAATCGLGVFLAIQQHITLPYTIEKLTTQSVSSFSERLALWNLGIDAFKERPFLGWGWENFHYYYTKHFKEPGYGTRFTDLWVDRTHNQIIDILVNSGVLGAAAYLTFWIVLFVLLIRAIMRQCLPLHVRHSAIAILAGLAAYGIQNLSIFDSPAPLILFYLFIALAYFIGSPPEDAKNKKQQCSMPLLAISALSFIIGAVSIVSLNVLPFKESVRIVSGIHLFSTDATRAFSIVRDTLKQPSYISSEGRLQFAGMLVASIQQSPAPPELKKTILDFAINELKKNISEHPMDVKSYYGLSALSRLATQYGSYDLREAEIIMKKASELAPFRSETITELFELYSMMRNTKEAVVWAEKYAKNFDPAEAHYMLGIMHVRNDDFKSALDELLEGDRGGANAFKDPMLIRYIAENIVPNDITKEYIAFINRGAEYYPEQLDFLDAKIVMHYRSGDVVGARKILEKIRIQNKEFADGIEKYLMRTK